MEVALRRGEKSSSSMKGPQRTTACFQSAGLLEREGEVVSDGTWQVWELEGALEIESEPLVLQTEAKRRERSLLG